VNETIVYIVGTVLSTAVTFGVLKNKLDRVATDIEELEKRIYAFRDVYVSRQEFVETMHRLREDNLQMRSDIRKVIELLSTK